MTVVGDAGPLIAAALRDDPAHDLAAGLVAELGRDLVIPEPVVVEVDYMLRSRAGTRVARAFLAALADGEHAVHFSSSGLLRRAIEFDQSYASLDLGYVDGVVMALAERERCPILTFDFAHFRATRPDRGFWQLIVDENRYRGSTP